VTINFKTSKLKKIFNSKKELVREYGEQNAKRIALRMAVLTNAPNLATVPMLRPERCHPLKGDREGEFAVDLIHPRRLVFCPNHDPIPKKEDGGIDLFRVTAVTILGVEDYHQ
jgi:proteic killer suppression protein